MIVCKCIVASALGEIGLNTTCYKRPFLKQVIVRADFIAPISALEKTLPPKLAKLVSLHFPISQPTNGIAKQFQFSPTGMQESETPFK
jgi:hypothetical protein